jgi:hypothetical protein
MSVYKKINEARIALQGEKLNKSGHNKFAGYTYFELGDFLPTINKIFNNIGLCGVISFGEDLATLTITDVDDNSSVTITSPMKEANLKGCHPIQNLGAVETYTRRYLWVTALEIVEHDVLDATTGKDKTNVHSVTNGQAPKTPLAGALENFDAEELKFLNEGATTMTFAISISDLSGAHDLWETLDNEEKAGLWSLLDSKTRSTFKKYQESLKQEKAAA